MPPKGYVNISLLRSLIEAIEAQHDYGGSVASYVEKMLHERTRLEEKVRERGAVAGWLSSEVKEWSNEEIVKVAFVLLNELGQR